MATSKTQVLHTQLQEDSTKLRNIPHEICNCSKSSVRTIKLTDFKKASNIDSDLQDHFDKRRAKIENPDSIKEFEKKLHENMENTRAVTKQNDSEEHVKGGWDPKLVEKLEEWRKKICRCSGTKYLSCEHTYICTYLCLICILRICIIYHLTVVCSY